MFDKIKKMFGGKRRTRRGKKSRKSRTRKYKQSVF